MQGGEHQTRSQGARVRVPAHWVNLGKVRLSIYKMRALDSMTDYLIIAMTRILNSPGPPPPLASQPSKGNKQYENKVLPRRWPQARSRTKAPCTIPAHGSFLRSLNHTTVTDYETASKFTQLERGFLFDAETEQRVSTANEHLLCEFTTDSQVSDVSASVGLERKGLINNSKIPFRSITSLHCKTSVFHAPVLQTVNCSLKCFLRLWGDKEV